MLVEHIDKAKNERLKMVKIMLLTIDERKETAKNIYTVIANIEKSARIFENVSVTPVKDEYCIEIRYSATLSSPAYRTQIWVCAKRIDIYSGAKLDIANKVCENMDFFTQENMKTHCVKTWENKEAKYRFLDVAEFIPVYLTALCASLKGKPSMLDETIKALDIAIANAQDAVNAQDGVKDNATAQEKPKTQEKPKKGGEKPKTQTQRKGDKTQTVEKKPRQSKNKAQ